MKKNTIYIFSIIITILITSLGVHSLILAKEDAGSLVSANENNVDDVAEREILSLLLDLRAIDLDSSIFESEAFKSLKDFGVTLAKEPVSRVNPFAPIGNDRAVATSTNADNDTE